MEGPTLDDRKYMMDMRKRYIMDTINPGLPLDIAPGMKQKKSSKKSKSKSPKRSKSKSKSPKHSKSKSKSPKRSKSKSKSPSKKKSPPKKKSKTPPKKKPSPPKPSQYNPLLQYQNLTPAQKKKYKREMIRTKRKASSRRTSGRNVTPFIRM